MSERTVLRQKEIDAAVADVRAIESREGVTRESLEKRLATVHGDHYVEDFDTLKAYLLLSDEEVYRRRLKEEGTAQWETDHLTRANHIQ